MQTRTKAKFTFHDVEFEVTAIWNRGYPATREEPGEPAGWELEEITTEGIPGKNIIDWVSDVLLAEAETALDLQASYDEDAAAAAREEYEERRREEA